MLPRPVVIAPVARSVASMVPRALALVAVLVLAALLGLAAAPVAGASWRWPVRGRIAEAYRYREATPFLAGQRRGIVIAAPAGAPVRSACGGRVAFAGRIGRAGRGVSVVCGELTATYLRLADLAVHRGARVRAGDRLGSLGRRGLHLGARRTGRRWAYLDPLTLLAGESEHPRAPLPPFGSRPRGPWTLGPAPVRPPNPRPVPVLRPRASRPLASPGVAVPLVAWLGVGLLAAGLPALGSRRVLRARRAAAARRSGHTPPATA